MKKLFSLLLAVILILPMGACAEEGGENMANYLTFASAEPFTIAVNNATKNWDGTLYYSTNATSWNEWDGTTAIESAEHGGEQKIYVRGSGNTQISDAASFYDNRRWALTGSGIRCSGNIENLLDYETVANGEHPTMGDGCFYALFHNCTSLIQAPELPALEMTKVCYAFMFCGCTGLVEAPKLPATNLYLNCYSSMFKGCTSLVQLPELLATTLEYGCYRGMFEGCTSLKVSTTQSDEYPYEYRIPNSGVGTVDTYSLTDMFADTGGEFTGTPSINTTYYLHKSNAIVGSKLSVSVAQMMDYDDATGLPELPDRNKEIHPYALIHSTSLNSTRHLIFSGCQIRQDVTVLEEVTPNNWVHYIADEGDESWIFIESSDTTAYTSGLAGIWWANYDVYHVSNDALYRAASEPVVIGNCVTENTATINFTCKDLLSTDAVYHIKAWCYPKGMDYWTAPATWESDLFAGPTHSESVTFTGLLPGVEYEVYAVIYGTDGATEHNAVTTFTTVASEEETPQAVVQYNELTATSFTAWLFTQGLEAGTDYTAEFSVRPKDTSIDTTPVIYKDVYFTGEDGFKAHSCEFTGLLPNTTYTVNVDLYPSDGSASIIACDCEVTTLEGVPVVVRDAFPLGFASGLCGLPITEADADYNTWAQGYIVGAAMRKAL